LSSLPKTGFIGASDEAEESGGNEDGGYLGQSVAAVINALNASGTDVTLTSLLSQLSVSQARFTGVNGWAQGYPFNPDEPSIPFVDSTVSASTSDFELDLVGSGSVPEPSAGAIALVAFGLTFGGRRRNAKRRRIGRL